MPFTSPPGALARAVKYAARWIDPKPIDAAHGGLLFQVAGGKLHVTGFNENATGRATIDVETDGDMSFLISGRLIAQLVDTFPDKPATFTDEGAAIGLKAGRWEGTLPAMSVSDYPRLPSEATIAGHVNGDALADAVARVAVAAGKDIVSRVALAGVHVAFGDGTLTLTATDSYRAVRQSVEWTPYNGGPVGDAAIVFASVLVDAAEAFTGKVDAVAVGWKAGSFSLTTPERSLVTRTIGDPTKPDDEFPTFGLAGLFATTSTATAIVSARDMAMPIKRADLIRDRKSETVSLTFRENTVSVSASSEASSGGEDIDAKYDGADCTVMVRSGLLHAALATAPGDEVVMGLVPESMARGVRPKPIVLTSAADPTWRHIVMPVQAQGSLR
jgi:DNA polymerase-3 subunit beta